MSEWLEHWLSALLADMVVEESAHFTHGVLRLAPYILTALGSMTHVVTLHDFVHFGTVVAAAHVDFFLFP
jgi:hypothetical protein